MMPNPVQIAMYADLSCPFAYLTHFRLRRILAEGEDEVILVHKSLALEYVNREPSPKPVLDVELPILLAAEPEIPYQPWHALDSTWPVTFWPAFEAVKCAERQSLLLADDLAWAIRVALFAESRCVAMRHVLLELAEGVGLDMDQFTDDFDTGVTKRLVIDEARAGWEGIKVPGSPTLMFPDGEQVADLALPEIDVDATRHNRPVLIQPAPCQGIDCLAALRQVIERARVRAA
jgi:predicted DsbA family dithiol-disulfide isomerase